MIYWKVFLKSPELILILSDLLEHCLLLFKIYSSFGMQILKVLVK
jgi:hypothetical protein